MLKKITNNFNVFNFYTLVETVFLLYLYNALSTQPVFKKVLLPIGLCYFLFWIKLNFIHNTIYALHPMDEFIRAFIFILLSIWLLIDISNDIKVPLLQNYRFWLVIAMLVFFSMSLIVFVTYSWFLSSENSIVGKYSWFINSLSAIIANIISTYGFICFYQRKNSFSLSQ